MNSETTLLEALKNHTATIHKEVEQKNLAKYIMDHTITKNQYQQLLQQNYQIYYVIETYLNSNSKKLPPTTQGLINFDKSTALRNDLELISAEIPEPSLTNIELGTNPMELLGAMYVIEGSMLGGMLIAKNLKKCKELEPLKKAYFFSGKSNQSVQRWKNFCQLLSALTLDQDDITRATDAAKKTFDIFNRTLILT